MVEQSEKLNWQKLAWDVSKAVTLDRARFGTEELFLKAAEAAVIAERGAFTLRMLDSVAFEKNVRLRDLATKAAVANGRACLFQLEKLPGGLDAVVAILVAEGPQFEQLLLRKLLVDAFECFEDYVERVSEIVSYVRPIETLKRSRDIAESLERLGELLGGGAFLVSAEGQAIRQLSADRNLFLHAGGIVDSAYLQRLKRWNLPEGPGVGSPVLVPEARLATTRSLLDRVASRIQDSAIERIRGAGQRTGPR